MALSLNLNQVSLNNIVTGNARDEFLTKEIRAYYDTSCFNTMVVEDTMPDTLLSGLVLLKHEVEGKGIRKHLAFLTKDGFAIIVHTTEGKMVNRSTSLELYKKFLGKFQEPKKVFHTGIQISVSKDLVKEMVGPFMRIAGRIQAFEIAVNGKAPKVINPLKFAKNNKGSIRTEETETSYEVAFDTRFIVGLVDAAEELVTTYATKLMAVAALFDLRAFKEIIDRRKKSLDDIESSLK